MNKEMTIQEASVRRLYDIDRRVNAVWTDVSAKLPCDKNAQHGKGTCFVLSVDGQDAHILCLACAIAEAESQLVDPAQRVTVAVAR